MANFAFAPCQGGEFSPAFPTTANIYVASFDDVISNLSSSILQESTIENNCIIILTTTDTKGELYKINSDYSLTSISSSSVGVSPTSYSWGDITGNIDNQTDLISRLDLKANLDSPTFTGTVGGLTKSTVGLTNVDNTSDINKPISSTTQASLDLKADKSLGNIDINSLSEKSNPTVSDYMIIQDSSDSNVIKKATYPVGGSSGTLWGTITGNINAQTDLTTLINNKADINSPTFQGTPRAVTAADNDSSTQLATTEFVQRNSGSSSSSAVWGDIIGTLSNQTDLNNQLNLKANIANPVFTGLPTAPTAAAGNNTTQIATTEYVVTAVTSTYAFGHYLVSTDYTNNLGVNSIIQFNQTSSQYGVTINRSGSNIVLSESGVYECMGWVCAETTNTLSYQWYANNSLQGTKGGSAVSSQGNNSFSASSPAITYITVSSPISINLRIVDTAVTGRVYGVGIGATTQCIIKKIIG